MIVETLDRKTWFIWDSKHGTIADVVRISRNRWRVEDYYSGTRSIFLTQCQALHYAAQLPDPADLMPASQ